MQFYFTFGCKKAATLRLNSDSFHNSQDEVTIITVVPVSNMSTKGERGKYFCHEYSICSQIWGFDMLLFGIK